MTTAPDYYEILQVSPNADEEIIQAAYRRLAIKWHPDKNLSDPFAYERMKLLNEAYETLSDSRKRREYNARRGQGTASGGVREEPPRAQAQSNLYDVPYRAAEPEQPDLTGYRRTEPGSTTRDVEQRVEDKNGHESLWLPIGAAFGAVVGLLTLVYGSPKQIAGMFTVIFVAAFFGLKEWLDQREQRGSPAASGAVKEASPQPKVEAQKEAGSGDVNGMNPAQWWIWLGTGIGVFILVIIAMAAVKSSQPWTEEEKANAAHFFISQKAMERAYATVRPYVDMHGPIRGLSEPDTQQVVVHLTLAVTEAQSVSPAVLAKAHPQLPDVYKNKYIRSLELAIRAHQSRVPNTEVNQLWNQWEDWWAANKKDVRFPDDVYRPK